MLTWLLKKRSIFWQGKILDLWTIPHTLSGFLIAYIFVVSEWNIWAGFFLTLFLAVLWEVFETKTGLSRKEPHLNGLGDVVVAQIGFVLGLFVFQKYLGTELNLLIAALSLLVFSVITLLGWISHRLYAPK